MFETSGAGAQKFAKWNRRQRVVITKPSQLTFCFSHRQQLKSCDDAEDAKMEEDRKSAEEAMKKKREEEYYKKQQYAQSILEQIEQNEKKRYQEMQMIKKVGIVTVARSLCIQCFSFFKSWRFSNFFVLFFVNVEIL